MRLQSLEYDVAWDLEDDVGNEEDHQSCICALVLRFSTKQFLYLTCLVLGSLELEIGLQTEDSCVRDIGPIEESEQIQDRENGNDLQVDLGQELASRDTVWRDSCCVPVVVCVGVCCSWMRKVWVVLRLAVEAIAIVVSSSLLICRTISACSVLLQRCLTI